MPLIYTGIVDILERTGHTVVDLVAVAVTAVLEVRVEHVGGAVHVNLNPPVAAAAVIRADVARGAVSKADGVFKCRSLQADLIITHLSV